MFCMCLPVGSFQVPHLPPTIQNHANWGFCYLVNVSVDACLSLYVSLEGSCDLSSLVSPHFFILKFKLVDLHIFHSV